MKTKQTPYENPVWIKYRCFKGAQFTAVKGGTCEIPDKSRCEFSGCNTKHQVRVIGETSDRNEAHNWFHSPYRN